MSGVAVLLMLLMQDQGQTIQGTRPEPPITEGRRREDALNQPSEGERSTDGSTPDRLICDLRRLPGSNLRRRVCSTVADRRRTRAEAQSTLAYGGAPAAAN